jgi:intraflagellar transport protein 56
MLTARPAASAKRTGGLSKQKPASKQLNELEFIQNRDYSGALALLEFKLKSGDGDPIQLLWWIGYAAFHNGNLEKAVAAYKRLQTEFSVTDGQVDLCLACCLFRLQLNDEAEAHLAKAPVCALKNRLLFHLAHRKNDEQKLMMYLQLLTEEKEDQLSLASMHYLRCHFQEVSCCVACQGDCLGLVLISRHRLNQQAAEIYKKLLIAHRDELALNVCVAMCYYKLDYWDVAMEILSVYLQAFPSSAIAVNLKACCNFRLYNGKAAEHELKALSDQGVNVNTIDIIRHNRVVFSNGEQALSVLPSLVDVVPEARLNLVCAS